VKYDPDIHHRRSIRLKGYDYKQAGAYFITVCTQDRACFFGNVVDGEMLSSDSGRVAQAAWSDLPGRFQNINLDEFVVMPNHIHGIILVGTQFIAPTNSSQPPIANTDQGPMNRAPTLGRIIRAYKAVTTRHIRRTANATFAWQRNYYEHIIRNDESLNRIRQYILDNPTRWVFDRENPEATAPEARDP
jgi:putative transposase